MGRSRSIRRRLIPASAGSTDQDPNSGASGWAHPRIRGERGWGGRVDQRPQGSSPHPRGAREHCLHRRRPAGLIPASAGSTTTTTCVSSTTGAHPRIRGEHSATAVSLRSTGGSSPHPRGALKAPRPSTCHAWLIPASAGSTRTVPLTPLHGEAHPRIRGEHWSGGDYPAGSEGSSPHPRGALSRWCSVWCGAGLIPASAGST